MSLFAMIVIFLCFAAGLSNERGPSFWSKGETERRRRDLEAKKSRVFFNPIIQQEEEKSEAQIRQETWG